MSGFCSLDHLHTHIDAHFHTHIPAPQRRTMLARFSDKVLKALLAYRGEREVLLTIKKGLKVGKHNALSVTPPLGARAAALTESTLPPLSVWQCGLPGGSENTKGPDRHRSVPIT